MANLAAILEAVRIRFAGAEIMSLQLNYYNRDKGGEVLYPALIKYEIAGSYISNNRVKIIIVINEFSCAKRFFQKAVKDFDEIVKMKISKRIPETNNLIDLMFGFGEKQLNLTS